jgi:hypothetical protein
MSRLTALLKADGFRTEQIHQIETYCDLAQAAGRFNGQAAWVQGKDGMPVLVCETIAEIMDKVRPGCRIRIKDKPRSKKANRYNARSRHQRKRAKSSAGSMVKVRIAFSNVKPGGPSGEFIWARRISKDTAKIENIPFMTSKLALGDLVRIDNENEVVEVLEHFARTRALRYADKKGLNADEMKERDAEVHEYLKRFDIAMEGMFSACAPFRYPWTSMTKNWRASRRVSKPK